MKISKSSRTIWIIFSVLILFVSFFVFPIVHSEWLMRTYQNQIKQTQSPEELRSWAMEMFALYATNKNQMITTITNPPPSKIPVSEYGPKIWIEWHEADKNPSPCLVMIWKGTRAMGLYVGNTNFVKLDGEMWQPGIYFYREP
jgi:hypothetical protein